MDEREKLKVCRDAGDPDLYVVDPRISMRTQFEVQSSSFSLLLSFMVENTAS
ncbi:MAG TPA: hypothetical protein VN937_17740 [Blastocatellia bacterium]|nr:hypothetical protein [Blastocatellia bacterium]